MAKKKNPRFSHDYVHCTGNDCPNREDCVNYLAFQEALELELTDFKVTGHCKNTELDYVKVRIEK